MGIITLAASTLSKEGAVFRYTGTAEECGDCGLKDVCHRLIPGRRYRISSVRSVEHDCPVHEGGKVSVVEVEELPLELAIPARKALEAALVVLDEPECPNRWCPNHILCTVPPDLKDGKVAIREIEDSLDCPRGLKLKKAIVEPRS